MNSSVSGQAGLWIKRNNRVWIQCPFPAEPPQPPMQVGETCEGLRWPGGCLLKYPIQEGPSLSSTVSWWQQGYWDLLQCWRGSLNRARGSYEDCHLCSGLGPCPGLFHSGAPYWAGWKVLSYTVVWDPSIQFFSLPSTLYSDQTSIKVWGPFSAYSHSIYLQVTQPFPAQESVTLLTPYWCQFPGGAELIQVTFGPWLLSSFSFSSFLLKNSLFSLIF